MHPSNPDKPCPGLTLARSGVGAVSMCTSCGVLTLTLQYLSLRFEPAAFRELLGMLAFAQGRLDSDAALPAPRAPCSADAPAVH